MPSDFRARAERLIDESDEGAFTVEDLYAIAEAEFQSVHDKEERAWKSAVWKACRCGGAGPQDPDVCAACMVVHYYSGAAQTQEEKEHTTQEKPNDN